MHPFCISIIHLTIIPRIFACFFSAHTEMYSSSSGWSSNPVCPCTSCNNVRMPRSNFWILNFIPVCSLENRGGGGGKHWCWVKVRSRINCILYCVVTSCCILLQYIKVSLSYIKSNDLFHQHGYPNSRTLGRVTFSKAPSFSTVMW